MGHWGKSGNLSASQDTMGASQDAPQEFRAAEVCQCDQGTYTVWPSVSPHITIGNYGKKHEKVST